MLSLCSHTVAGGHSPALKLMLLDNMQKVTSFSDGERIYPPLHHCEGMVNQPGPPTLFQAETFFLFHPCPVPWSHTQRSPLISGSAARGKPQWLCVQAPCGLFSTWRQTRIYLDRNSGWRLWFFIIELPTPCQVLESVLSNQNRILWFQPPT